MIVNIRRETHELLNAWNRRITGNGITPPEVEHQDGTVDLELPDTLVEGLKRLGRDGEDFDRIVRRLVWHDGNNKRRAA